VNELRRELLDESGTSAELSPELRFLAAREGALAGLVLDHVELYQQLITRYRTEGSSPDLQAIALAAAGNLGTVLQSMRSRQDLVNVLAHTPERNGVPLWLIDQLFHCFVMLTEPCTEDEELTLLSSAGAHQTFFDSERMRDWLLSFGVVAPTAKPAGT
jgi:hypothetical protein